MIVELNGLPGCGKTTIKKEVISNKSLIDLKAIGVEEFRGCGKNKVFKAIIKIKRIFLVLNPRYYDLIVLLYKAMFKSKVRNEEKNCNFYEKFISIIYIIYLYNEYRKKSYYIISDEGIIQALSSATTDSSIDDEIINKILKKFSSLTSDYLFVNCSCSIRRAEERVIQRNRHDSAIDELRDSKLRNYLIDYNQSLEIIREKIEKECFIEINADDDICKQVTAILRRLNK